MDTLDIRPYWHGASARIRGWLVARQKMGDCSIMRWIGFRPRRNNVPGVRARGNAFSVQRSENGKSQNM